MEPQSLDYLAVESALKAKRSIAISAGDQLGRDFFEWCKSSEFGLVEIMGLFPKNRDLKAKLHFLCEFPCPECGEFRWEHIGRMKIQTLISWLKYPGRGGKGRELHCLRCQKRLREERELFWQNYRGPFEEVSKSQ